MAAQLPEEAMLSTFAAQCLRAGAKSWFLGLAAPNTRAYCQDVPFDDFLREFRREFMIAAPADIARQRRAELVQDGTVEQFVLEWRRLDAQLAEHSTDDERRFMFMSKLKAEVRAFVGSSNPKSLSAAVAAAMRYSTQHEVSVSSRGPSRTTQLHNVETFEATPSSSDQLALAIAEKLALNVFTRGPVNRGPAGRSRPRPNGSRFDPNDPKIKKCLEEGLCFQCKQKGHLYEDCPRRSRGTAGAPKSA